MSGNRFRVCVCVITLFEFFFSRLFTNRITGRRSGAFHQGDAIEIYHAAVKGSPLKLNHPNITDLNRTEPKPMGHSVYGVEKRTGYCHWLLQVTL